MSSDAGVLRFLRDLMQIPSLSGSEAERACSMRAVAEMRALGFDEAWVDEHTNAIGVVYGRADGPAWLLVTHPDVVNVGDLTRWTHPPFDAVLDADGDTVHGRGAVDIKGPLAANVHALGGMLARGERPHHPVVVLIAADEEIGGAGADAFVRALPLRTPGGRSITVGAALICEPSGNRVMLGHRGVMRIALRFAGSAHHAAFARHDTNPHFDLAVFLSRLRTYHMPAHPVLGASTAAPTMIYADTKSQNVTPNELTLMLDWRFGAEQKADFERILGELGAGLNMRYTVVEPWQLGPHNALLNGPEGQHAAGFAIDPGAPLACALLASARAMLPAVAPPGVWHFATDGRYTAEAGIPTIGFGPGDPALAHTSRERISLREIDAAIAVYQHLLAQPLPS